MKKILSLLVAGMLLAPQAYAGDKCSCEGCSHKMEKGGGFVGEAMKPVSLAEVQKMPEDARVAVEGYIVEQLNDDEYMFTDGTNQMRVEIDSKRWRGQTVTPKDKVYLRGKVEQKHGQPLIDVKAVNMIK